MSHDGERFVPSDSTPHEIRVNVERYLYAMKLCENKTVIDIGTGSGLGTYLYSLVAKSVIGIDYSDVALQSASTYPHNDKIKFLKANIEKDLLPEAEVAVCLEVIEHISNPDWFLGQLKAKRLVFSVPLNALAISSWHKYDFRTVRDVENLIGRYFSIEDIKVQNDTWVVGTGFQRI